MKKFYLLILLSVFIVQAQTFPDPYCNITDNLEVEEITSINFGETSITNTDTSAILLDHTATVVNVTPGETYTLSVEGNTYGPFDSEIYAFIDWNQNGILDDENEAYELGLITNTNGYNQTFATMEIIVPMDAVEGETRIRIMKIYTDPEYDTYAIMDPCAINMEIVGYDIVGGFGQAIDFTLNIEEETVDAFPAPYCDIADDGTIEEITSITFGETSILNTDVTTVLIDETATVVNITPGETYSLIVEGNTRGNFDTNIVAFIDWNQNGILDDENEIYEVGTLTDTNGYDETMVSLDITAPMDAEAGPTRIRITKTYTDPYSVAEINPCAIEMDIMGMGIYPGYGQAIDFTLNIEEAIEEIFPSPYCDIPDDGTVEEITSITFAETNITNTDVTTVLIDETDTFAHITPGETYTLSVEGNTRGNFDTNIVAFIDWNQNGILDDENEIYEIGTLSDTNGYDDTIVSLDITVPMDALAGPTRIRITKTYTDPYSVAEINPCAIEMDIMGMGIYPGYGQAIDFTLNIGDLGVKSFDGNQIAIYPVPTTGILHVKSKSELKAVMIYNLVGQEVYAQSANGSDVQLDISRLKAGVYILNLFTQKGEQHSTKIIKK